MTIEDKINDKKLRYDINREAAKISALSSSKINKYEYLTGGEILPYNQQQVIKQVKFTYSPLGKAFEKQTKTIEEQGKEELDALANLKPKEIKPAETKPGKYGDYFLYELAKIRESNEPIDLNNFIYRFKDSRIPSINFSNFKGPMHIFKDIHNGDILLEDVEKDQIKLKSIFNHIRQGNSKKRAEEQKKTINKIGNL